jgi:hypothetical protein
MRVLNCLEDEARQLVNDMNKDPGAGIPQTHGAFFAL